MNTDEKAGIIEVLVSFDTTGSMYPCITMLRREIEKFTKTLFKDIPKFRMGLIAHGDYCDDGDTYVIKTHELSTNQNTLIDFIRHCGNTGGGDSPECYELVLHSARAFNWTAGKHKVLVLIGDDIPINPTRDRTTNTWTGEMNWTVSSKWVFTCMRYKH